MIPRDGDLFQIWLSDVEDKVVFEGWVLGKDEVGDTPARTFRIYAFVSDPRKVIADLAEKHGPLTTKYSAVPYTKIYICDVCNASYSAKECFEEHKSEH